MSQADLEAIICQFIGTDPRAMYDLGVGNKSEWKTLGERYPKMELYGCEPYAPRYQQVEGSFPGKLLPVGIGRSSEPAEMYVSMVPTEFGVATLHGSDSDRPVGKVELWTLDQFDEWAGCPEDILLWMDIEGGELDALRGGTNLMQSGRVKWINLELWPEPPPLTGWCRESDVNSLLLGYGYECVLDYAEMAHCHDSIYIRR